MNKKFKLLVLFNKQTRSFKSEFAIILSGTNIMDKFENIFGLVIKNGRVLINQKKNLYSVHARYYVNAVDNIEHVYYYYGMSPTAYERKTLLN